MDELIKKYIKEYINFNNFNLTNDEINDLLDLINYDEILGTLNQKLYENISYYYDIDE